MRYQPYVCNECHDVLMVSINLNDIGIMSIYSFYYRCDNNGIDKNKVKNLKLKLKANIEIEKHKFDRYKDPVFLNDVNINNILISNKISSKRKNIYFIGYADERRIKPLTLIYPKTKNKHICKKL